MKERMVSRRARVTAGALAVATSLALVGVVGPSAGAVGHAGRLTVTHDEQAFLATHRIAATESFTVPVSFDPAQRTVRFIGVNFRSRADQDPYWTVDETLYRKFSGGVDLADAGITFRGTGAVHAFGFLLHPFGTSNRFVVRVIEADGKVTNLWLDRDAGDTYLGLSSRIGIKQIVIVQKPEYADGVITNFGFDDVARSYIVRTC